MHVCVWGEGSGCGDEVVGGRCAQMWWKRVRLGVARVPFDLVRHAEGHMQVREMSVQVWRDLTSAATTAQQWIALCS